MNDSLSMRHLRTLFPRWLVVMVVSGLLMSIGSSIQRTLHPLYLIQIGFPLVAAWSSTGVIINDVALELVAATGVSIRRLWLLKTGVLLGTVLVWAISWLIALQQGWLIIGYSVLLIIAATGWAHWFARWRGSSMIGNIGIASILLSQYGFPSLWLTNESLLPLNLDRWLKIHLFFPLDADPMFRVFHAERWLNTVLITIFGLVAWLWCYFSSYTNIECLIVAHTDES